MWQLSAQSAQLKSDEGFLTLPGDCLRAVGLTVNPLIYRAGRRHSINLPTNIHAHIKLRKPDE